MKLPFVISAAIGFTVVNGCAPQVDAETEGAAIHKSHNECVTVQLAGNEDVADQASDVQAILDLEQGVFDAQIAGDFEAWLSSFAEDAIVMAPNLPAVTNKPAIRQWYAPYFEQFHLHEEVDEREVEVAGDWAYIRAHWTWTLTPKSGGEAVIDVGKSIWILRRQRDGSWKIARAIYNSDIPLSGQE